MPGEYPSIPLEPKQVLQEAGKRVDRGLGAESGGAADIFSGLKDIFTDKRIHEKAKTAITKRVLGFTSDDPELEANLQKEIESRITAARERGSVVEFQAALDTATRLNFPPDRLQTLIFPPAVQIPVLETGRVQVSEKDFWSTVSSMIQGFSSIRDSLNIVLDADITNNKPVIIVIRDQIDKLIGKLENEIPPPTQDQSATGQIEPPSLAALTAAPAPETTGAPAQAPAPDTLPHIETQKTRDGRILEKDGLEDSERRIVESPIMRNTLLPTFISSNNNNLPERHSTYVADSLIAAPWNPDRLPAKPVAVIGEQLHFNGQQTELFLVEDLTDAIAIGYSWQRHPPATRDYTFSIDSTETVTNLESIHPVLRSYPARMNDYMNKALGKAWSSQLGMSIYLNNLRREVFAAFPNSFPSSLKSADMVAIQVSYRYQEEGQPEKEAILMFVMPKNTAIQTLYEPGDIQASEKLERWMQGGKYVTDTQPETPSTPPAPAAGNIPPDDRARRERLQTFFPRLFDNGLTPELIEEGERLGYSRAYLQDALTTWPANRGWGEPAHTPPGAPAPESRQATPTYDELTARSSELTGEELNQLLQSSPHILAQLLAFGDLSLSQIESINENLFNENSVRVYWNAMRTTSGLPGEASLPETLLNTPQDMLLQAAIFGFYISYGKITTSIGNKGLPVKSIVNQITKDDDQFFNENKPIFSNLYTATELLSIYTTRDAIAHQEEGQPEKETTQANETKPNPGAVVSNMLNGSRTVDNIVNKDLPEQFQRSASIISALNLYLSVPRDNEAEKDQILDWLRENHHDKDVLLEGIAYFLKRLYTIVLEDYPEAGIMDEQATGQCFTILKNKPEAKITERVKTLLDIVYNPEYDSLFSKEKLQP